jgi:hypothetical protein
MAHSPWAKENKVNEQTIAMATPRQDIIARRARQGAS